MLLKVNALVRRCDVLKDTDTRINALGRAPNRSARSSREPIVNLGNECLCSLADKLVKFRAQFLR